MGYTFTIGNAVPEFSKDYDELSARWVVNSVTRDDAPTFPNDDMTGNSNSRSPSYSVWADFCRDAGIYDLFYDEIGHLLAGHPGCVLLKQSELKQVEEALAKRKSVTKLQPGFCGFPKFDQSSQKWITPDEGKYDSTLARLIWLQWWMKWALDNCETPAIQNT